VKKSLNQQLPSGWRLASLGDKELVEIIMGQSPPGHTYNKEGIGLPFFQGCKDFSVMHPETRIWCSQPRKIAETHDILLSVRAPVGPTNLASQQCCIGRGLAALRCKVGLSHKYLILILRNFEKKLVGSGSIFTAIGRDQIRAIEFPLPPTLDDQIAIANELEQQLAEVERVCHAALRRKEAVAALQGAMLREVFPYEEGDELPEGWRWEKIGDHISDVLSGLARGEKSRTTGYTHLRMNNISTTFNLYLNETWKIPATKEEADIYSVQVGDLLFNNTNSIALVGKSCVFDIPTDEVFLFSNHLTRIRTKDTLRSKYLLLWFNALWQRGFFRDKCDRWVNQAAVRVEELLFPSMIPLPPTVSDQELTISKFEERKRSAMELVQGSDTQLEAIESMPSAILREIFSFSYS
jgi:type I restriction enzyme S subunit